MLPEDKEDANLDSSPSEELDQDAKGLEGQADDSSTSQDDQSSDQDAKPVAGNDGVIPKKNVEGEVKRRLTEEMMPLIQQIVRETIQSTNISSGQAPQSQQTQQSAPSQPQYSLEQLDWIEENKPEYIGWARQERMRMIKEEAKKEALDAIRKETTQEKTSREKQDALGHVISNYGEEVMVTLPSGQRVWNTASPLYQRAIQIYQSRPTFQNDGMGLAGAFDMAYGAIAREEKLKMSKDKIKMNSQSKRQEKQVLQAINGGSQAAPGPSTQTTRAQKLKKLNEEYAKSGGKNRQVLAEILKERGLMPKFE